MGGFAEDKQAYVYRDPISPWRRFVFPYDPLIKDCILTFLPRHTRWWDPEEKCWWILDASEQIAISILEQRHYRVMSKRIHREDACSVSRRSGDGNIFESLFKEVPEALQLTVYRHLALALHPDRGGSTELMSQLNVAWGELRRE